MADAGATLHRFAVWCAAASLARLEAMGVVVDPRLREALAVKLRWVDGLASDEELARAWALDREFLPAISESERDTLHGRWRRAVARTLNWEEPRIREV